MKWFINMKIGKKLVLSFILVALICGAMGAYAIYNLKSIANSDTELYVSMTVPLSEIGQISSEFQQIRVDVRDMIIAQSPEEIQKKITSIEEKRNNVDELSKKFEKTILSNEMREAFKESEAARVKFREAANKVIELAKQNKDTEALLMMSENGESGKASKAYQDSIEKMVQMKVDNAKDEVGYQYGKCKQNYNSYDSRNGFCNTHVGSDRPADLVNHNKTFEKISPHD